MSGQFARSYLGIGEVLVKLRSEFPEISVSKIRFLESEGLISPARSPSGYRRFSPADVEQLRFVLTAQRDEYLPLRVIRERLAERGQPAPEADQPDRPESGAAGGQAPGRRPGSDIFLDDVTVSRRHAEFYRHGATFAVRDVGSLNGTYVNRQRIEEVTLGSGDEVQIGKFRLVFLQGHQSYAESGG